MIDEAYVKKLERRIHNQRVALRQDWEIVETRMVERSHYQKPKWFERVKELIRENRQLRAQIEEMQSNQAPP